MNCSQPGCPSFGPGPIETWCAAHSTPSLRLDACIQYLARHGTLSPLRQAAARAFPWEWTDSHGEYDGQLRLDAEERVARIVDAERDAVDWPREGR